MWLGSSNLVPQTSLLPSSSLTIESRHAAQPTDPMCTLPRLYYAGVEISGERRADSHRQSCCRLRVPYVAILAAGGKPNMRVLIMHGEEIHRCSVDPTDV
jgi:hypothetical protein